MTTEKCPSCGKFVELEEAFYTREEPEDETSYMVACCDEVCATSHENSKKRIKPKTEDQQ